MLLCRFTLGVIFSAVVLTLSQVAFGAQRVPVETVMAQSRNTWATSFHNLRTSLPSRPTNSARRRNLAPRSSPGRKG